MAIPVISNLVKSAGSIEDAAEAAIRLLVRVVFPDLAEHFALPQSTLSAEPTEARGRRLPD